MQLSTVEERGGRDELVTLGWAGGRTRGGEGGKAQDCHSRLVPPVGPGHDDLKTH